MIGVLPIMRKLVSRGRASRVRGQEVRATEEGWLAASSGTTTTRLCQPTKPKQALAEIRDRDRNAGNSCVSRQQIQDSSTEVFVEEHVDDTLSASRLL